MEKTLKFFLEIEKLKNFPRTGWVLRKVKDPETIADHSFRVALANWLLGEVSQLKLSIKKIIKMSLVHDWCEVYAGDVTPFFYFVRDLPKDEKEREKFLKRYVRLSKRKKDQRAKEKFELEKKSLLSLLRFLSSDLKKEIFSLWLEYERGLTKEGDFVRQGDKVETLIQAIEYFGPGDNYALGWWEEVEEFVHQPIFFDFLSVIEKKFYEKRKKGLDKSLSAILDFVLEAGKLKRMRRLYWKLRGVKNQETVAGHIFTVATMALVFAKEKSSVDEEKLLKMTLVHEISAAKTGETASYEPILRGKKKEKAKNFWQQHQKEKKALESLTKKLPEKLKKEINFLWEDSRLKKSEEGKFLSQLNIAAVLFQEVLYKKTKKDFSTASLWEWALAGVKDPLILKFLNELKKYEKS